MPSFQKIGKIVPFENPRRGKEDKPPILVSRCYQVVAAKKEKPISVRNHPRASVPALHLRVKSTKKGRKSGSLTHVPCRFLELSRKRDHYCAFSLVTRERNHYFTRLSPPVFVFLLRQGTLTNQEEGENWLDFIQISFNSVYIERRKMIIRPSTSSSHNSSSIIRSNSKKRIIYSDLTFTRREKGELF